MRSEAVKHQPGARPFLLLLLIGALTTGIFGMHGLVGTAGSSGIPRHSSMAAGMDPSVPMPGRHGMVESKTTGAAASSPMIAQTAGKPAASPAGADMGDMLMLCLAILTVAAGALMALLALRQLGRRIGPHMAPCAFALRPVPAHLRSGPPPAWRFSVIRC